MNPQYQNIVPSPPMKRKSSLASPKVILLILGVVAALVVAISFLVLSSSNTPTEQMQRLSVRLDKLTEIVDLGTQNAKNADLRKAHTDASILIAGQKAAITSAMENAGLSKIPKEITALETDEATLETLTDAQLNGRFDEVYKTALAQKIESTMALMRELNNKTNSQQLKTTLATGYEYFNGILDQLAKL